MLVCGNALSLVSFMSIRKPFPLIMGLLGRFLGHASAVFIRLALSIPTRRSSATESSEEAGWDANASSAATRGTTVGTTHCRDSLTTRKGKKMSLREDKSDAVVYPTVHCIRANRLLSLANAPEYFIQPLCAQGKKACPHHGVCQETRRNLNK